MQSLISSSLRANTTTTVRATQQTPRAPLPSKPLATRGRVAGPIRASAESFAPDEPSPRGRALGLAPAVSPLVSREDADHKVGRGLAAARPETSAQLQATPLPLPPSATKVTFGAELRGVKVDALTREQFKQVERMVLQHQVLVIRDQAHLSPEAQLAFTAKFDPESTSYGHGKGTKGLENSVLKRDLVSIPDVEQVKLLGNGLVKDHHGIEEVELKHPQRSETTNDDTTFYRWHIDAALFRRAPANGYPPKVTTLLALKVPGGRRQTVHYNDGTGHELDVSLGATAFVSGYEAYRALSPEDQAFARRAQVRYAPHPYVWMREARLEPTGLGVMSEGRELSRDQLPAFDPEDVKTFPMLWKNPETKQLALQVHAACVEDILIDGKPIGDLKTTRARLQELMRPGIDPERVYAHDWQAGDFVVFNNRGVWHSVVGSLRPDDLRVFHQCNLDGSTPPMGPGED